MNATVSETDRLHLDLLRENIRDFLARSARAFRFPGMRVLDIAPQDHAGIRPHLDADASLRTLDIDPGSGADYIADICACNGGLIADGSFDVVVCTEVLEHVRQPFSAVEEIRRMLAPGGIALVSTPFNFRIHGPLPDCWRFTEHGLRELFRDFEVLQLDALETEGRFLMPVQYTLVARRHSR